MSLTLMTVDQLRARVETALTDDDLEQLGSDCEDTITAWAGPFTLDGDDETVAVTETLHGRNLTLLRLKQPIGEVITVTDTSGDTDTDLVIEDDNVGDWRIRGDYLERADGHAWGDRTTVQYVPADARYKRRQGLVKLVQLELNFQPGFGSQQAGPWAERYGKYAEDKQMILNDIYMPEWFA